jgi:hypothetical protein
LGGFVVAEYYGLARPTADVDIIRVRGASSVADVQRMGGKGSALAKKHRVYIDDRDTGGSARRSGISLFASSTSYGRRGLLGASALGFLGDSTGPITPRRPKTNKS